MECLAHAPYEAATQRESLGEGGFHKAHTVCVCLLFTAKAGLSHTPRLPQLLAPPGAAGGERAVAPGPVAVDSRRMSIKQRDRYGTWDRSMVLREGVAHQRYRRGLFFGGHPDGAIVYL